MEVNQAVGAMLVSPLANRVVLVTVDGTEVDIGRIEQSAQLTLIYPVRAVTIDCDRIDELECRIVDLETELRESELAIESLIKERDE